MKHIIVLHGTGSEALLEDISFHLPKYSLVLSSNLRDLLERNATLRSALESAEGVISLMPDPGSKHRVSIAYETGVAVGLGKPVIVVASKSKLGRNFQDLPVLDPSALDSLPLRLDVAIRQTYYRDGLEHKPSIELDNYIKTPKSLSKSYNWMEGPRFIMPPIVSEYGMAHDVEAFFRMMGAEVVTQKSGNDGSSQLAPDMVIWHDDLQLSLGNPLPIEFVDSKKMVGKALFKLEEILKASGGRTLLAVTSTNAAPSLRHVDTGIILIIPLVRILLEQKNRSISSLFSEFLREATQ